MTNGQTTNVYIGKFIDLFVFVCIFAVIRVVVHRVLCKYLILPVLSSGILRDCCSGIFTYLISCPTTEDNIIKI